MAKQFYRQCSMVKGTAGQVAWIPENFAVAGSYVMLGDDDGWMVESVGPYRQSEEYRREHERDYKTQRSASDI